MFTPTPSWLMGLVQPTDISLRNPPFWVFDLDTLKLSQLNNGTEVAPLSPTVNLVPNWGRSVLL